MSEDVRTFSTIGNLILRTSLFRQFLAPPPAASSYLQDPLEGFWRVLAVKSGASLNPNPVFMQKVFKSLQFLKVTATLTAY